MRLTRPQFSVLMLGILALAIGLVTNIASGQIPERLKPYLWYSWPLLILLTVAFLILTIKAEKETDGPPSIEFDLKQYYLALLKRYRTLDLDALTPPQREEYLQLQLRSVFVEQSVRENPPPIELPKEILEKLQSEGELKLDDLPVGLSVDEIRALGDQYYKNPPSKVIDVLTGSHTPHVVVLGDPGSGKSTLTRYIVLSLVDSEGDERLRSVFGGLLPVLVELRTYNALREERKCDTFLEFLEFLGKTDGWNLTQTVLHEKLTTKGGIVIFDGLDEVFDPADRERISHAIVGFAHTYPKTGVIVTSRVVGYQRKVLTDAGFAHYTLQDLDRQQVESFVTRWYDTALADRPDDAIHRKQRILQSFDQSASVRQLAGNPMLLTIMAIIAKNQELPRERWKLYDHAASVLIEHWDVKRHLESINVDAPFIEEEDKKELLRRLAYRMQAGSAGLKGNYIYRDQLQKEFHDYLVDRFNLSLDRATTISRIMIDQFRQRNFILSLYGASVYGFVHRAFLEYFCATAFTYKFEKARELSIEQLKKIFEQHSDDESWHEVLRLICGILNERFAGDLIKHLLELTRRTLEKSPEPATVSLELALNCFTEVRNRNRLLEPATLAVDVLVEVFSYFMEKDPNEGSLKRSLSDTLGPIESIGNSWPGRTVIIDVLKEFPSLPFAHKYADEFGRFVASIGAELDEVRKQLERYARDNDPHYRAIWPSALAMGWQDDMTFDLLKNQAQKDSDVACRANAVTAMGNAYFTDSRLFNVMGDRAKNDPDSMNRFRALLHLPAADDSASEELLSDIVINDDSELVRLMGAVSLFSVSNTPKVRDLIFSRLCDDSSPFVRVSLPRALLAIRVDKEFLNLVFERAVKDPAPQVRIGILELLYEEYENRERLLQLLRAREQEENDPEVRKTASTLLRQSSV